MEEIRFLCKDGKNRKGCYISCKSCEIRFITRQDQPSIYCSFECKHKNNCLVDLVCRNCQKTFPRQKSKLSLSKNGIYFCSRKCKDSAQKIGGIKEIMPAHYGTGNGTYLIKRLSKSAKNCCDCNEKRLYLLCIHHIDGNDNNNIKENLEIVCHNCHVKRHLKFNGTKWIYSTKFLTPREMLCKL